MSTGNPDGPTTPIGYGGGSQPNDGPTRPLGGGQGQGGQGQAYQTPGGGGGGGSGGGASGTQTQIVGGQKTPGLPDDISWDPMRDPVVGWLVVIQGKGKGSAVALGYGQNTVGRGDNARRKLAFGGDIMRSEGATVVHRVSVENMIFDDSVSRTHFIITYDGRGQTFYIQSSPDSTNLTYIRKSGQDEPVLQPTKIEAFQKVLVGNTVLMFVPLCHRNEDGTGFDWQGS